MSDGVTHITPAMYLKSAGDPAALERMLKAQEKTPKAPRHPTRAEVLAHPSAGGQRASRGPWVLSIEGLGRPITMNAERTSSMSKGTLARVRAAEREWRDAVATEARRAGIPPLQRAFAVFQAFYPNNVVVDPDALPSCCKAGFDGLVDAGVLPNDRREQLALGYHQLPPVTDGGPPRVTVTVFPLP